MFWSVVEHTVCRTLFTLAHRLFAEATKFYLRCHRNVDPLSLCGNKKSNELIAHTYSHLLEYRPPGFGFLRFTGPEVGYGVVQIH